MEDIAGKDLTSLKANANKVSNLQEIVDLFESQCADQLKQLYTYTDSKEFGTQVNLNVINPTLAYLFIAAQQYGLRLTTISLKKRLDLIGTLSADIMNI